jgi:hypothetical protein
MLALSAKRKRAMLANNPPRNSRPVIIADDGQGVFLLSRPIAGFGPVQEAVSRLRLTSSNDTSYR